MLYYSDDSYSDDEDEYRGSGRRLQRFPSFHNTSPLTYYPQRHILGLYNGSKSIERIKLFEDVLEVMNEINSKYHRKRENIPATDDPKDLYLKVFEATTDMVAVEHEYERYMLYKALTYCTNEVNLDLKAVADAHPALDSLPTLLNLTPQNIESIVQSTSKCYDLWRDMCKIRNLIQRKHVAGGSMQKELNIEILGYSVWVHNEILIFVNHQKGEEKMIMTNYEQFLMLVDVVSCRLMCRLACQVNDFTAKDELPSHELLLEVYRWGDALIKEYGLEAYALIGEYETLVTNHFVNYPGFDPLELGVPFTEAVMETSLDIFRKFGIEEKWTRVFISIFSRIQSPNVLSELFGLRKHWGNPMVDATASSLAVQEKIKEDLPIDGAALIGLTASFNRMIVLEYIKHNRKWPDCEFITGSEHTPLYRAHESDSRVILETAEGHKHEHWALLRFKPNCVIDDYYDQVSYLSDKSISYYREHLDYTYVRQLHKACPPGNPEEKRRLLIEFLRKQHMSVMDICATVMRDEIPYSWLCNSACMKGGEMKHICARIFAVFPFELRQYFTITEDMIKKHIFKYNPYQTMTMKEVDLMARLRGITEQMNVESSERELNVIHIIDFSKWNLRMKYANTAGVFKSIDDFMGTPGLIESTHVIFADMINIVQDSFNPPPDPVENASIPTIWKDHIVGWEGQRQKGWTSVTSAILSNVELKTGVSSTICGQGDNQIMLSKFKVPSDFHSVKDWIQRDPQGVRAVLDQYYKVLEEECGKIGLKIKTAETCRSLSYLNYGKKLFFNGVELSMSLKRISKMMTEPNDFFPTTEQRLKTQEGSIYAANMHSHPSMLQYFISRVGVYFLLDDSYSDNPLITESVRNLFALRSCRYDSRMLSFIMKVPPSLGGPPQQMLPAYLCRGHPDPLCEDLVMVCLRARAGDRVSLRLLRAVNAPGWYRNNKTDKSSIIHAPFSLNLNSPLSATKPLTHKVEIALKSYCKNPDIKELFGTEVKSQERELVKSLSTMDPFQPLVANDIFERSLPGRKRAFIMSFTNASSFGQLVKDSRQAPIISEVERLEKLQLIYWIDMWKDLENTPLLPLNQVPQHHVLAQNLRNLSWGCHVEGVTVPHPLEMMKMFRCDPDVCTKSCVNCEQEHIVMALGSENLVRIPTHDRENITTIRSHGTTPYLGNVITEGLTSVELRCENPNAPLEDAIRLEVLKGWVSQPGSNLEALIENVQETRTDVPKSIIKKTAGTPSRNSYNHRANMVSVVRGCAPCSTTNMFSRMYISSNRMGRYSHGDDNYHLAFGPTYLVYQALLALQMLGSDHDYSVESEEREVYHIHVRTPTIPRVYDGYLEVEDYDELTEVEPPSLLFAYGSTFTFTEPSGAQLRGVWWKPDMATITECKWMYANQLIANSMVNEMIAHELMLLGSDESYPPRTPDISIGDILLVGPRSFCYALACNILFLLPMAVIASSGNLVYKVACRDFLENLSEEFWAGFISPMTHPRILNKLMPFKTSSVKMLSRTYKGTRELLKDLIVDDLCTIWNKLRSAIMQETTLCCMIIGASSFSSTRALLSKFFEICVSIIQPLSTVSLKESIIMGRSLVGRVHQGNEEDFRKTIIACQDSYLNITRNMLKGTAKHLPEIKIFSTRDVWIDIIKKSAPLEQTDTHDYIEASKESPCTFVWNRSVEFPEKTLITNDPVCDCDFEEHLDLYQSERYFAPHCSAGKTGHSILEILQAYTLDIKGVVIFGSKIGTEAAGISRLSGNEWVYVNTPSKMSEFAPHAAGIAKPPAFWSEGIGSKLVDIPSTVLCTNSLLVGKTYVNILNHLYGLEPTGAVLMLSNFKDATTEDSLRILSYVSTFICVSDKISWVLISVKVHCDHQLKKILSMIGCVFRRAELIYPTFNQGRSRIFCILGTSRKQDPERELIKKIPKQSASSGVLSISWIPSMLQRVDNFSHAPCYLLNHNLMLQKISALDVFNDNLMVLREKYIPGWRPAYGDYSINESDVLSELDDIYHMLYDLLVATVSVSMRVRAGLPIVRSNVLMIEEKDVIENSGRIMNKLFRVIVLRKLLMEKCKRMTIDELTGRMDKLINKEYIIPLLDAKVKLRVQREAFISKYAGILFELLGRIWNFKCLGTSTGTPRLFHRLDFHPMIFENKSDCLTPVRFSRFKPVPKFEWSWTLRSWVTCLLYVCKVAQPDEVFLCSTSFGHIINQHSLRSIGLQNLRLEGSRMSMPCIYWLRGINPEISKLKCDDWIMFRVEAFSTLAKRFSFDPIFYTPWSGVKPSRVIARISSSSHADKRADLYPDVEAPQHMYNLLGRRLVGCCCISCTAEVFLCETLNLTQHCLNQVCHASGSESIIMRSHRLLPMEDT